MESLRRIVLDSYTLLYSLGKCYLRSHFLSLGSAGRVVNPGSILAFPIGGDLSTDSCGRWRCVTSLQKHSYPGGKSGDHKDKGLRNFSNTAFQVCFYLVRIQNHGVNLCKNLQKESSIYPESKLYQPTSPSPSCISIPQGVLSENTQPLDVQVFHCGSTLKIKSRVQDMTLGNRGSVLKFEWVVYCLNPMQW